MQVKEKHHGQVNMILPLVRVFLQPGKEYVCPRVSSLVSSGDMRLSRPDEGHGQAPCALDANGRRLSQLA
jgi:hypothetical protein